MYHRLDEPETDANLRDEAFASDHDGSTWDAVQDLDQFLVDVYRFYKCRGLSGIIAKEALNCVALLFTVSFSFTLVFFVDWHSLSHCSPPRYSTDSTTTNEPQCRDVSFFYTRPFQDLNWYHFIALLYFASFFVFTAISIARGITEIRKAADMKTFYELKLRVYDVSEISWAEVLDRLSKRQNVAPFCIKQDTLSPLEMTNILMRQDNFLIALINHSALFTGLQRWIPKRILR